MRSGAPLPAKVARCMPPLRRAAASVAAALPCRQAPVIVYVRPEDEFLHQQASGSFTFPVEGRAVGKNELQPLRLVMLLPAGQVPAARCVGCGRSMGCYMQQLPGTQLQLGGALMCCCATCMRRRAALDGVIGNAAAAQQ